MRQRLDDLSKDVFLEVLAEVSPDVVLTEGIETYVQMRTWLREMGRVIDREELVRGTRDRRLYLRAQLVDGPALIGIRHRSWPLPVQDRVRLRALLARDVATS